MSLVAVREQGGLYPPRIPYPVWRLVNRSREFSCSHPIIDLIILIGCTYRMRRLALRLTGCDSSQGTSNDSISSVSRHGHESVKEAEKPINNKSSRPEIRQSSGTANKNGDAPSVPLGFFSGASWLSDRIIQSPSQAIAIPTKDDSLINFDACIEACDSLAASSGDHGHATVINGASSRDCSVMVSPEGELLVIPRANSPAAREPFLAGQEYRNAIVMGRDLEPDDRTANGFSALGWNPARATHAIEQSKETMNNVAGELVEEIVQAHVTTAALMQRASQRLNGKIHISDASFINEEMANNKISASTMNALVKSQGGPFLFPGGTIHNSLLALSLYYSKVAQSEAKTWGKPITTNNHSNLTSSHDTQGDLPQNGDQLLQYLHNSIHTSMLRARRRENSIQNAEKKLDLAERKLRCLKEEAKQKWKRVQSTEEEIQQILEEKVRERNKLREQQRLQDEFQRRLAMSTMGLRLESQLTPEELWELVGRASEDLSSFAPIGFPKPNLDGPLDRAASTDMYASISNSSTQVHLNLCTTPQQALQEDSSERADPNTITYSHNSDEIRDTLELDMGLYEQRLSAMQADELVNDAAGHLLNILSTVDTTKRSARVAAETTLLSMGNMQASILKALVLLEKNSLQERLAHLSRLEEVVSNIDVRADLDNYIEHDKKDVYGATTRLGYGDDGGQASALAVLNCHSEGIGLGIGVAGTVDSYCAKHKKENSSTDSDKENPDEGDGTFREREKIEEAVAVLFSYSPQDLRSIANENLTNMETCHEDMQVSSFLTLDQAVVYLMQVTRDTENLNKARACRASTCYAINRQRGIRTQLHSMLEFDSLCHVLDAILTGCDREAADVANAKMCMMLSQTFYYTIENGPEAGTKLFPKIRLCQHTIWSDDDFWTQALFQCVTDSLTNCGVMSNFEQTLAPDKKQNPRLTRVSDVSKLKWHDLSNDERCEAASQVHAVIFAQLLALAHSMVEFGCSIDFACAFVRRLSVRHQLPLSQRLILVQHITRKGVRDSTS